MEFPAVLSLVLLATFTPVTYSALSAMTNSDRDFTVAKHNDYRANEPAASMPTMTWSSSLESEAQAWADGCHFAHQSGKSWGENIAMRTGGLTTNQNAISLMFDQWTSESQYNTDGSFSCCSSSDYSCCHLTQIVWADTTEVGCGLAMCSTLTTSSGSYSNAGYLVCYYSPRGNSPTPTCTWDWSPYQAAKK